MGVVTAGTVGRPRLVPVELAWTLVRGMKGVTRHTFDRAALKVATTAFDREFCRQVEKGVQTLPLVVIPPSAAPAKPAPLSWADIVFEKDGVPMADSRKVAEVFEKRHDHVLRDIDRLLGSGHPDLGSLFTEASAYNDKARKDVRFYVMNRDGYGLLAMGFTGPRALTFKLGFIHAFNAMEIELRRRIEEDRIKALAEAKAALADAERGRKQAEDQRVGAQRAATAIRESMDKQANELKALRAQA